MRLGVFFAAGLLATSAHPAHAIGLKDCSSGSTRIRLVCLQKNVKLLNADYEIKLADFQKEIASLQARLDHIKIPSAPDLSGYVKRSDSLKLGFDASRCLAPASGVGGELPSSPPIKAQLLTLMQDCGGAPSLNFH